MSLLLASYFAVPMPIKRSIFPFMAVLAIGFFLSGMILVVLTMRSKTKGKHRLFLLLTGGSSMGFLASILLHNLVYGLFIFLFGSGFWESIGMGDEPFFFIVYNSV